MTVTTIQLAEQVNDLRDRIKAIPAIKVFHVDVSRLGPVPSIIIKVGLDERDTWINGIFQNSRHAMFSIHGDMKLEMFTCWSVPKFRKCSVNGVDAIIRKLTLWTEKV